MVVGEGPAGWYSICAVVRSRSRGPSPNVSGMSRVKLGGVPRLGVGGVAPDVGVTVPDVGVAGLEAGVTERDGISKGSQTLLEGLVNSCQSAPPS